MFPDDFIIFEKKQNDHFPCGWLEILRLWRPCPMRCPASDVPEGKKPLFYVINPNNEVNCPVELPKLFQIKIWTQSNSPSPRDFQTSQHQV